MVAGDIAAASVPVIMNPRTKLPRFESLGALCEEPHGCASALGVAD